MGEIKKCPKCDSEMEEGELLDQIGMSTRPQLWAKQARSVLGLGTSNTKKIISFRCKSCGYLENYAP